MAAKTKKSIPAPTASTPLYSRVCEILESARSNVARTVNTTQVIANWLIGREIVEEEQQGKSKAGYGEQLLNELSVLLQSDFGKGYSATNLRWFRQFYLEFPALIEIHHAVRDESVLKLGRTEAAIHHALRDKSETVSRKSGVVANEPSMSGDDRSQSWQPGQLNPNLSWTHYRILLRVGRTEARNFYEIEAPWANKKSATFSPAVISFICQRLKSLRMSCEESCDTWCHLSARPRLRKNQPLLLKPLNQSARRNRAMND